MLTEAAHGWRASCQGGRTAWHLSRALSPRRARSLSGIARSLTMDGASDEENHVTARPARLASGDAGRAARHPRAGDIVSPAGDRSGDCSNICAASRCGICLHDTWGRTYAPFANAARRLAGRTGASAGRSASPGARHLGRSDATQSGPDRAGRSSPGAARLRARARRGRASHSAQPGGFLARPARSPARRKARRRPRGGRVVSRLRRRRACGTKPTAPSSRSTIRSIASSRRRSSAICCCAFSRTAIGGNRRCGPDSAAYRSLAICFELLGQFEDAIATYRPADAALRGDALIALGQLQPFLDQPQAAHPWQTLWQAYRAHALCLLGFTEEALRIAQTRVADRRLRMGPRLRMPAAARPARRHRSGQRSLSPAR